VVDVPELPFPLTPSQPGVWERRGDAVVATAPARTDLYVDPGGADPGSTLNAPTLLGRPPEGDFQLTARVTVDFRAGYDAGVLLVWIDERHWAKLCFEFSPASRPMVVSVVTREVSDDANAFVVEDRTLSLRLSRTGPAYAFHAATEGAPWQLIRVFTLGGDLGGHRVGLEAQSPGGDGCTVTFDRIAFTRERVADLRDGS
jgi:uncharacterized protein